MLANRTDEVRRQCVALVDVTAHGADESCLDARGRGWLLLYVFLVVAIRHGLIGRQHLAVRHVREKKCMRAEVGRGYDVRRDVGIRVLREVYEAVRAALKRDARCLVNVPAALKSPMLERLKLRLLCQYRHVEFLRLHDHIVRQIFLVDRDRDAVRLARDLRHCVRDAAIVALAVLRRQHIQAIRNFEHRFVVHDFPSNFGEHNHAK